MYEGHASAVGSFWSSGRITRSMFLELCLINSFVSMELGWYVAMLSSM
jgi:hypothetical protein